MKPILKKLLLGVVHPQEYICVKAGEIHEALFDAPASVICAMAFEKWILFK